MDAEEVQAADARRRMREEMDVPEDLPEGGGHYADWMESGGWASPSEIIYTTLEEFHLLPEVPVIKRGGIRFPWFRVETAISTHKSHWWSRRSWRVHIRYHDGERNMHHYMTFYKSTDASNAEQIIKFVAQTANEKYWSEK